MERLLERLRKNWLRILAHAGALLPLLLLVWDAVAGTYLIDPVQEILSRTGNSALILLLLTLSCTPIQTIFGFNRILRIRKILGLYAFFYALLHFFTFVGLDYNFNLAYLRPAFTDQPFVLIGLAALLILVLLAFTSTQSWQRRLGKRWKRVQQLIYVAAALVIVHIMWVRKEILESVEYLIILVVLLFLRLPPVRRGIVSARKKLTGQGEAA
ncbi:MAG: sulfite oxidase heme-binding subunit YedZ [Anaerolineales bacterium]